MERAKGKDSDGKEGESMKYDGSHGSLKGGGVRPVVGVETKKETAKKRALGAIVMEMEEIVS